MRKDSGEATKSGERCQRRQNEDKQRLFLFVKCGRNYITLHNRTGEVRSSRGALTDSVNNPYVNRKLLGEYGQGYWKRTKDFYSSNNGSVKLSEAPKKARGNVRDVDRVS